ncbi:hypothetical protein F2P81_010778 [Scophthalmus maximus]|uniref:Uncharacterized protein n=1 Tax=Scophthalmus maximus TaxID=52904 RepID=A0A6A4T3U6_SCOMX|nr:hypothetical protein F2P81_010778 [Scophthalmus maximus]
MSALPPPERYAQSRKNPTFLEQFLTFQEVDNHKPDHIHGSRERTCSGESKGSIQPSALTVFPLLTFWILIICCCRDSFGESSVYLQCVFVFVKTTIKVLEHPVIWSPFHIVICDASAAMPRFGPSGQYIGQPIPKSQFLKIAIKTANMMFRDVGRSYLNASGKIQKLKRGPIHSDTRFKDKDRESGVVSVSQHSTPAQDTITRLLLKSKGLSVGFFLWALFQVTFSDPSGASRVRTLARAPGNYLDGGVVNGCHRALVCLMSPLTLASVAVARIQSDASMASHGKKLSARLKSPSSQLAKGIIPLDLPLSSLHTSGFISRPGFKFVAFSYEKMKSCTSTLESGLSKTLNRNLNHCEVNSDTHTKPQDDRLVADEFVGVRCGFSCS